MRYILEDRRVEAHESAFIAPTAVCIGSVTVARNASVWWNAVLRGDCEPITIGEETNVQDGCVLHTDPGAPLVLGRNVTIGHMAMLHGCIVGDNSVIGIGAVVLNGAKIGANCLIASKALVRENAEIPDNSMVVGIPGKVVRQVTPELAAFFAEQNRWYVGNRARFKESLKLDEDPTSGGGAT